MRELHCFQKLRGNLGGQTKAFRSKSSNFNKNCIRLNDSSDFSKNTLFSVITNSYFFKYLYPLSLSIFFSRVRSVSSRRVLTAPCGTERQCPGTSITARILPMPTRRRLFFLYFFHVVSIVVTFYEVMFFLTGNQWPVGAVNICFLEGCGNRRMFFLPKIWWR